MLDSSGIKPFAGTGHQRAGFFSSTPQTEADAPGTANSINGSGHALGSDTGDQGILIWPDAGHAHSPHHLTVNHYRNSSLQGDEKR